MRIVTVLNSRTLRRGLHMHDQEYNAGHVYALQAQIKKWAPQAQFECITDRPIEGVTCHHDTSGWPGWWLKMGMFSPEIPGDFLFMDLDTVIHGPLDDILAVNKLTLLRDFYRDGKKLKAGLGGALIYLPEDARREVWDYWMEQPQLRMREYPRGDMFLFERFYMGKAQIWQDVVPGQVVSWKVHCAKGIPPNARVICMHGLPRPWYIPQFLHLYR